jgi:hypothetical protein
MPLQLDPELRRDRRLHGAHIGEDLGLGMRADDQRRGDLPKGTPPRPNLTGGT